MERAESALREARELHKSRGGLLVGAETALKGAKKRHSEVKEQLSRLEGQWRQRRDGLGFTHDDGFSAVLRDVSAQETLETAIHSYDMDMQRALTTRDNAEKEARGLKRPDLSQLEEAERKAREERKTEARNLVAAEESRKMLEKLHQNLETIWEALLEAEHSYGVVGRLSDVANGRNAYRLSFQRFVLTALLDDVLLAASRRLQGMSRGRYQLLRNREQSDQRSLGGGWTCWWRMDIPARCVPWGPCPEVRVSRP
ncbi:MAG: hypothetical protein GY731_02770 [Gammaproteobacteria bacterium]|nr:hypothetical protein [Gammaproteobacteria bacterium]